jgi:hypothetical protein
MGIPPEYFRAFFRKGQVIETFRGEGIYQPAVDRVIEKLRAGAWVRVAFISFVSRADEPQRKPFIFLVQIQLLGEGKVCQSDMYKADPQTEMARLQRFKWGMCVNFFWPVCTLQWPNFDGYAPPADDRTYVCHWYVLK